MLEISIYFACAFVSLAIAICAYRVITGPDMSDRILALDTLCINAIALILLLGIQYRSTLYFEGAVLIAMLGFVGTSALAKFLLRGDIIE